MIAMLCDVVVRVGEVVVRVDLVYVVGGDSSLAT